MLKTRLHLLCLKNIKKKEIYEQLLKLFYIFNSRIALVSLSVVFGILLSFNECDSRRDGLRVHRYETQLPKVSVLRSFAESLNNYNYMYKTLTTTLPTRQFKKSSKHSKRKYD